MKLRRTVIPRSPSLLTSPTPTPSLRDLSGRLRDRAKPARGFVYLAVVLDWFSRRLLAWRLSVTMEASVCIEALEDALAHHGKPEIVNTDQGAQFTGLAFTGVLTKQSIASSMDGKGAWRDNVFVERLWRTTRRYTYGPMRA